MSERKDGGLAFGGKRLEKAKDPNGFAPVLEVNHPGMTLRDYFAGQALAGIALGMMQSGYDDKLSPAVIYAGIATASYAIADAMLEAREPTP